MNQQLDESVNGPYTPKGLIDICPCGARTRIAKPKPEFVPGETLIKRILERISVYLPFKFRRGMHQHSGHLWDKTEDELLHDIREEVVDLVCYVETLLMKREARLAKAKEAQASQKSNCS